MITVRLDVPEAFKHPARYACRALAVRWGLPLRFASDASEAHLHYTTDATACPAESCTMVFDPALYRPETVCHAVQDGAGRWSWRRSDLPARDAPDLIGGAFRLLTYLDETQIAEERRDARGIFLTDALPPGRRQMVDTPLVEQHAATMLDALTARHPRIGDARVPRWPGGRRLALVPSHDVDAVDLSAPLELATNLAKTVLRRRRDDLDLVLTGISTLGRRSRGPYFAFPRWREWERERGLRSAFYVFFRPAGVRRAINDCKSALDGRGTDWRALRAMAVEGWEFGLHPAIHTKDTASGFAESKQWLEARLGCSVDGLRHHYWALDWRDPTATHRQHQAAGFSYDSSIAWRDRAGFRAGTALPYHPFDPAAERELDLLELPCSLMDGHILEAGVNGGRTDLHVAVEAGRDIVGRVTDAGGMLVTNWHQEVAFNRGHAGGYMETLERVLEPLHGSSDVWVATPQEVSTHWKQLTASLLGDAGGSAA